MGQMTHGVLYGAKIADPIDFGDAVELGGSLYDVLEQAGAAFIFVDGAEPPHWLAGFWLAVGGEGEDGLPVLGTVQLSEIPVVYSERYDAAKAGWPQVEAAVAAAGVKDFAPPSFWIAKTGVNTG